MKDIMTVSEVAKFLLCDVSTVYKHLKSGKMDYFKIGSRIKVPRKEVLKFVEKSNGGNNNG